MVYVHSRFYAKEKCTNSGTAGPPYYDIVSVYFTTLSVTGYDVEW